MCYEKNLEHFNLMSTNIIKKNLNTKFLGKKIYYYQKTNSTNDDVWNLFKNENANNGTLVVSDNQKRGKGRGSNQWYSETGLNLTFSFLLNLKISREKLGLISLLVGVGICKGIYHSVKLNACLKWPNDIILDNKKVGGILIESKEKKKKIHLCVGIGINVNSDISKFPIKLQKSSISLISKNIEPIQRELLLSSILNFIESEYLNNFKNVTSNWLFYCSHVNKNVKFHHQDKIISGEFLGITNKGYAKIKENNKTKVFSAGELLL